MKGVVGEASLDGEESLDSPERSSVEESETGDEPLPEELLPCGRTT